MLQTRVPYKAENTSAFYQAKRPQSSVVTVSWEVQAQIQNTNDREPPYINAGWSLIRGGLL